MVDRSVITDGMQLIFVCKLLGNSLLTVKCFVVRLLLSSYDIAVVS